MMGARKPSRKPSTKNSTSTPPKISAEAIAAAAAVLEGHHVPYREIGPEDAPYFFCTGCNATFAEYPGDNAHEVEMALLAALPFLQPSPVPAVDDVDDVETIVIHPAGETER